MTCCKWRERLLACIEADKRKDRRLSLEAKLGPNFVGQFKTGKERTSAQAVIQLCEALGVSITYIFTGAEMTPEDEEVLKLFASLSDDQKSRYLGVLRDLQPDDATPE